MCAGYGHGRQLTVREGKAMYNFVFLGVAYDFLRLLGVVDISESQFAVVHECLCLLGVVYVRLPQCTVVYVCTKLFGGTGGVI